MRFADIPGHEAEKERLRRMADGRRIPHALLLHGTPGIGKFALARAFAQYIHCTDRTPDGDSCGRCPNCLQHVSHNHIDTIYSFPVLKRAGGKATISNDYIAEFRQYLDRDIFLDIAAWPAVIGKPDSQPMIYADDAAYIIDRLTLTAHQSEYKIVLMWLPERLGTEAANKLLKAIEEPSHDTIFILTSDNPAGILGTIYSRTQRIEVQPYTEEEIAGYLMRRYKAASAAALAAARLAEGSMHAARLLLAEDAERAEQLELFKELMRKAWQRKVIDLRAWSQQVAALGREGSIRFYEYCSRLIRENFILNLREPALNALTEAEQQFCSRFSPYVNERNVIEIAQILDRAISDVRGNGNGKLISFDVAVQMILLLKR